MKYFCDCDVIFALKMILLKKIVTHDKLTSNKFTGDFIGIFDSEQNVRFTF